MMLNEYQVKAAETAMYVSELYPYKSLVEEKGELFGKLSKTLLRGDNILIRPSDDEVALEKQAKEEGKGVMYSLEVVKEIGDASWMAAMALRDLDINLGDIGITIPTNLPDDFELWSTMQDFDTSSYLFNNTPIHAKIYAKYMFEELALIALFLGYSFNRVLEINIEKLSKRAENKVIKGAGDLR